MSGPESLTCDADAEAPGENARRTGTTGDLDPTRWQPPCGPYCGNRLRTVFVGLE